MFTAECSGAKCRVNAMSHAVAKPLPPNQYNPFAWITGEPEIGEGCWIGAFTLIDGLGGLKIGRHCDISSGVKIISHSTVRRCVTERVHEAVDKQPTEIGDHVFIGSNAVVLMGAKVGHHSIIGAGAVVLEGMKIPPYSLVAGVPARIVRSVKDEFQTWKKKVIADGL
jgi:acetyltransferase-like isoleucine patch superfamily enzyme